MLLIHAPLHSLSLVLFLRRSLFIGWARCKWGRGQRFEGTPLESHLFVCHFGSLLFSISYQIAFINDPPISGSEILQFPWQHLGIEHIHDAKTLKIRPLWHVLLLTSLATWPKICHTDFWAHLCLCTVGSYASLSVCPSVCDWTKNQTGPKFRLDKKSLDQNSRPGSNPYLNQHSGWYVSKP